MRRINKSDKLKIKKNRAAAECLGTKNVLDIKELQFQNVSSQFFALN
jgi:hypothetical protein